MHGREYQRSHDLPFGKERVRPTHRRSVKCEHVDHALKGGRSIMKMKIMQEPIVFVAIVEVGNDYTERLITIKADRCSLEEAQQIARDAGYQVITELCDIVHTIDEIHVIVAVEPTK